MNNQISKICNDEIFYIIVSFNILMEVTKSNKKLEQKNNNG